MVSLNLGSLIMILICGPMCFTALFSGKMLLWSGLIMAEIWMTVHIPAILIFTINHQKKVEEKQPPKALQFHDEDLETQECKNDDEIYIISQSRRQNLIPIDNPSIPNQII